MEEIKEELRQDNTAVKSNAVAKLAYVSVHYDVHGTHASERVAKSNENIENRRSSFVKRDPFVATRLGCVQTAFIRYFDVNVYNFRL